MLVLLPIQPAHSQPANWTRPKWLKEKPLPRRCDPSEPTWLAEIPWPKTEPLDCNSYGLEDPFKSSYADAAKRVLDDTVDHCICLGLKKVGADCDYYRKTGKFSPGSTNNLSAAGLDRGVEFMSWLAKSGPQLVSTTAGGKIAAGLKESVVKYMALCASTGVVKSGFGKGSPKVRKWFDNFTEAADAVTDPSQYLQFLYNAYESAAGIPRDENYNPSSFEKFFLENQPQLFNTIKNQSADLQDKIDSCEIHHGSFREKKVFLKNAQQSVVTLTRESEAHSGSIYRCWVKNGPNLARSSWIPMSQHKFARSLEEYYQNAVNANLYQCHAVKTISDTDALYKKAEERLKEQAQLRAEFDGLVAKWVNLLNSCQGDGKEAQAVYTELSRREKHLCIRSKYSPTYLYEVREKQQTARPDSYKIKQLIYKIEQSVGSCNDPSKGDPEELLNELSELHKATARSCDSGLDAQVETSLRNLLEENKQVVQSISQLRKAVREVVSNLRSSCDFEAAREVLSDADREFYKSTKECVARFREDYFRASNDAMNSIDEMEEALKEGVRQSFEGPESTLEAKEQEFLALSNLNPPDQCNQLQGFVSSFPASLLERFEISYGSSGIVRPACQDLVGRQDELIGRAKELLARAEASVAHSFEGRSELQRAEAFNKECDLSQLEAALREVDFYLPTCDTEATQKINSLRAERDALKAQIEQFEQELLRSFNDSQTGFSTCQFSEIASPIPSRPCLLNGLGAVASLKLKAIEQWKEWGEEVLQAREALRSATAKAPSLLSLCKAEGASTSLDFRNAERHANFLRTFPERCIQNSPELQTFDELKKRAEAQIAEVDTKRQQLLARWERAKADLDWIPAAYASKETSIGKRTELEANYGAALRTLESIKETASPSECYEDVLQKVSALRPEELKTAGEDVEQENFDPIDVVSSDDVSELDAFLDDDDSTQGISELQRQRSGAQQAVAANRSRAENTQRTVLESAPNYNEDRPNLDRYEDAVDRGRQQRGEREFYDTPFPTEQRERARTRTASPQTGNCRARCEQTANAAVAQQREALKGGGGYNSQVEAQLSQSKKQVLDTCMSTCSGNVTGVDRSCLERCQGATSQDELLSCQRRCYSK